MVRYLLCLLVTTIVQVECFRVPLPYGTGYQGSTDQDDEFSDQGIFHLPLVFCAKRRAKRAISAPNHFMSKPIVQLQITTHIT